MPQEDSEYPDGFYFECPASSYKILDNRNITIKCKTCPECSPGQEPAPPCGSTIFIDTSTECKMCVSSETFSEEHSSGACKPCQSCGLRDTISPCTPEKNTQCGACQRGHYQADLTMDSCEKCSSCCGRRSYVELQCIYLKLCNRKNCVQQTENKQNHPLTLQNIIQTFTTPAGRARHIKREHQNILQGGDLNDAGNIMALEVSMFQTGKERFKRGDNPTLQKADIIGGLTTKVPEASSRYHTTGAKVTSVANKPDASLSVTKSKFDGFVDTAPEQKYMKPTMPLNSSYVGNLKKRMNILIAIASFGLLVLIFIFVIVTCNFWKRKQSGQTQGSGNMYNITCCVTYAGDKEEYRLIYHDSTPQSGKNSKTFTLKIKKSQDTF